MTGRICPQHGDLVRELALGLLDDAQAAQAEDLRVDCNHCLTWWNETFGGEAFAEVDSAVAAAFADFSVPARRKYGWLAAAAALVLAVGVSSTSMLWRNAGPELTRKATPLPKPAVLTVMDFEAGSISASPVASTEVATTSDDGKEALFRSDLESGDLSSWSFHS